MTSQKQL
jgi:hypothetical protein